MEQLAEFRAPVVDWWADLKLGLNLDAEAGFLKSYLGNILLYMCMG